MLSEVREFGERLVEQVNKQVGNLKGSIERPIQDVQRAVAALRLAIVALLILQALTLVAVVFLISLQIGA